MWARVSIVVMVASFGMAGVAPRAGAKAAAPFTPPASVLDPAGDVPLQQGDILAAGFAATSTSLVFGMQVAKPTDLSTDPSWVQGFAFAFFQLDADNDGRPDYLVQLQPNGDGTYDVFLSKRNGAVTDVVCDNRNGDADVGASIADYGYTLSFPKKCLPANLTFRFQAAIDYSTVDGPSQPTDYAPGADSYSDPVTTPAKSVPVTPASVPNGYWMLGADGRVYPFGGAIGFTGSQAGAVAMTPRRDGKGYWVVDGFGRVVPHGAAVGFGGSPALRAGETITTIAATATGKGYWLFSNAGRVFPFGDAHTHGDLATKHLNGPIVASTATASGHGYYMVGRDGGIFAFGDARFHGSTGALRLNRPVVGMAPTPTDSGYWLVASDGGVFAFGAPFRGSMGGVRLNQSVDGIVAYGNGYLMAAADGGIFDFSNRAFLGSLAAHPPSAPVIGLAAVGN